MKKGRRIKFTSGDYFIGAIIPLALRVVRDLILCAHLRHPRYTLYEVAISSTRISSLASTSKFVDLQCRNLGIMLQIDFTRLLSFQGPNDATAMFFELRGRYLNPGLVQVNLIAVPRQDSDSPAIYRGRYGSVLRNIWRFFPWK